MRTFTAAGLTAFFLLALAPPTQAQSQRPTRAWIFVDCPAGEPVALSEAARTRRALRGSKLQDSAVAPACRSALEAAGALLRVESTWLHAFSADLDDAALTRVQALPFVRALRPVAQLAPQRVAPTFGVEALAGPVQLPVNCGASCAQLTAINALAPLDRGINGAGVKVGFLDTEYGDFNHLVFARMRSEGRLGGYMNFAQGPQGDRHGLNTTSVAVGYSEGNLIGPGWGATLYAATTEYDPSETNVEEDNFVRGLEWLEAQGVDVVNASLSYTEFDPGQRSYTYANLDGDTGVTTRAADAAAARGVVMVVSAGNSGCGAPTQCWYYIGTPADGDSVIAVGATTLQGTKATFSSFGPTADGRIKPDVSAPGVSVVIANPFGGYGTSQGTSFSAPLVTGVVAQMLQVNPSLTPIQVRTILRSTASQAATPDNSLGWGVVNADRAIRRATALTPDAVAGALDVRVHGQGAPHPMLVVTARGTAALRAEAFDLLGRRAAVLYDGPADVGLTLAWPADLAAGAYVVRLTAGAAAWSGTVVTTR